MPKFGPNPVCFACLLVITAVACEPDRSERRTPTPTPTATASAPAGNPPRNNTTGVTPPEACNPDQVHCGAIDPKVLEACKALTPPIECAENKIPKKTYEELVAKVAGTADTTKATAKTCTVNVSSVLNLRSSPDTKPGNANIIASMPKGEKLEYISEKNGWVQGKYKGQTGWACKTGSCTSGQGDFLKCESGTNLNLTDPSNIEDEPVPNKPTNSDGSFG